MTNSSTSLPTGAPSGDAQGAPVISSFHPTIQTRFQDDSKDRDSKRRIDEEDRSSRRRIEEEDAKGHRDVRQWFVKATIGTAIGISLLGTYLVFNHQDPKVRELSVSLVSAPIAGLFGVLAGMALK